MRKLVLVISLLFMSSSVFAALDTNQLAKNILEMHNAEPTGKGSFAIVYGGEDISRSGMGPQLDSPILVA